jgi:ABC-type spermidine/putrescine transport system permease subunit I
MVNPASVLIGQRGSADKRRAKRAQARQHNKFFYVLLAAPGIIWLAVLFLVPFYDVIAIAAGRLNFLTESPVAVYNPFSWSHANLLDTWRTFVGATSFEWPIVWRTLWYTTVASGLCLLVGYPAAYFVARFAGRRKALFLVLLIAPFWISYMMRMLAWIDLLQPGGYLNKTLGFFHLPSGTDWLGGHWYTVVLGLVYGYIPYIILVLYAGLDRIDGSLLEAGRDLGLGRAMTFVKVTLPLSRQPILTGMLITVLPMLGDYFTNQLMSGTPGTAMIGNVIDNQLNTNGFEGQGAVLSLLLLAVLVVPMVYYVLATAKSARSAS